jgi:Nucleotide modification associated domain 2
MTLALQVKPRLRRSVHADGNRNTDLSGENVLLSDHFYYFGDKPVRLPDKSLALVHSTQGHKSRANEPHADEFIKWLEGSGHMKNQLPG